MAESSFFENAVRNLPGGLILVDLQGHIQAVNETAQTILGLFRAGSPGASAVKPLSSDHPQSREGHFGRLRAN